VAVPIGSRKAVDTRNSTDDVQLLGSLIIRLVS